MASIAFIPAKKEPSLRPLYKTTNGWRRLADKANQIAQKSYKGFSNTEAILICDIKNLSERLIKKGPGDKETLNNLSSIVRKNGSLVLKIMSPNILELFPSLPATIASTKTASVAMLSPLIEDRLFLGGETAYQKVEETQITHVIKVSHDEVFLPEFLKKTLTILDVGVPDADTGKGWDALVDATSSEKFAHQAHGILWFDKAFKFLDEALQNNKKVLIHCSAGISRSTTLAIAYFMSRFGVSFEQAFAYVKEKRPVASPNSAFTQGLHIYGYELRDLAPHPIAKSFPDVSQKLRTMQLFDHHRLYTLMQGDKAALLFGAPKDDQALKQANISRVIQIRKALSPPSSLPKEISGYDVPIAADIDAWEAFTFHTRPKNSDKPGTEFDAVFDFIDKGLKSGQRVLIDFSDGVNQHGFFRALLIAYLVRTFGTTLQQSDDYIASFYGSGLHPFLIEGLKEYAANLKKSKGQ